MSWHRSGRRWIGLWMALAMILVVSPAWAQQQSEQIEGLQQRLDSLEEDAQGVVDEEFDQATEWLEQARQLEQRGVSAGAEQHIRRVDHMLDLLQARVATERMRQSIEEQRASYEGSKKEIERLRKEIEDLEAQRDERKRELERLRQED